MSLCWECVLWTAVINKEVFLFHLAQCVSVRECVCVWMGLWWKVNTWCRVYRELLESLQSLQPVTMSASVCGCQTRLSPCSLSVSVQSSGQKQILYVVYTGGTCCLCCFWILKIIFFFILVLNLATHNLNCSRPNPTVKLLKCIIRYLLSVLLKFGFWFMCFRIWENDTNADKSPRLSFNLESRGPIIQSLEFKMELFASQKSRLLWRSCLLEVYLISLTWIYSYSLHIMWNILMFELCFFIFGLISHIIHIGIRKPLFDRNKSVTN